MCSIGYNYIYIFFITELKTSSFYGRRKAALSKYVAQVNNDSDGSDAELDDENS